MIKDYSENLLTVLVMYLYSYFVELFTYQNTMSMYGICKNMDEYRYKLIEIVKEMLNRT